MTAAVIAKSEEARVIVGSSSNGVTNTHLVLDVAGLVELPTNALISRSIGLLGKSGQGKTNTGAVIIEFLLGQGVPLTIVDIEGEYWGLKEKFPILIAGRRGDNDNASQHIELEIEPDPQTAAHLAELSVRRSISVILDLSEFSQAEMMDFLLPYFQTLWQVAGSVRRPYEIILEEAHEFVPQSVRTPLKEVLTRIALRGRKRGLGIMLMSQRNALLEKNVVSQARLMFLHKVEQPTDLDAYKGLVPLPAKQVEQMVAGLEPGKVIALVEGQPPQVVQVKHRQTYHVGATPEFNREANPIALQTLDAALIAEFKQAAISRAHERDEQTILQRRVKSLEAQLDAQRVANTSEMQVLQTRIQELERDNRLLAQLKVSADFTGLALPNSLSTTVVLPPSTKSQTAPTQLLPKELNIEKAHVRELNVAGGNNGGVINPGLGVPSLAVIVTPATLLNASTSQPTPKMALPQLQSPQQQPQPIVNVKTVTQKRAFTQFIERLSGLSKLERAILKLLVSYSHNEFASEDIAAWLNRSEADVRNNPPSMLLKLGLVSRRKIPNRRYVYKSTVLEFLHKQYPDLETAELADKLTSKIDLK